MSKNKLKKYREMFNHTTAHVAAELNIEEGTLIKYEKGIEQPSFADAINLAGFFNQSLISLFSVEQKKPSLKDLRVEKGVSQRVLGDSIGVSDMTIGKAEKNNEISILTALKIAKFFTVKVDDIWRIEDIEKTQEALKLYKEYQEATGQYKKDIEREVCEIFIERDIRHFDEKIRLFIDQCRK